jgi:hypothetical protein
MDARLIQANLALFKGEHAEVGRLLNEVRAERPPTDDEAALMRWLDAQIQPDRNERLRRLGALVAGAPPDNTYARLAARYLAEEDAYRDRLAAVKTRSVTGVWKPLAFVAAGALVIFLLMSAVLPNTQPPPTAAPTLTAAPTDAPPPPDRSQALVADSYTARYPAGILQITAVESDSARVLNANDAGATPVPGARFYALSVVFECRSGVCDAPPGAVLALQLDNGDLIKVRDGLRIAGEKTLQPVALGRTTSGWVVFEVPLVTQVKALVISPLESGPRFDPISLSMTVP